MEVAENNSIEILKQLTEKLNTRDLELKKSEKKFKTLFYSSSSPIVITDSKNEKIIDANPSFCLTTQYDKSELVGKKIEEFIESTEYKKKNVWIKVEEHEKGGLYSSEYINTFKTKNGHKVVFYWSISKSENKELTYAVGQDITEEYELKKQIEEIKNLYQSIIDNSEDLIKVYDKNLSLIFCSKSIQKLSGYSVEEHMKMGEFSLIHPDDLALIQDCAIKVNINKKIETVIYRGNHKDRGYMWAEAKVIPILDSAGEVQNILAIVRDIHEQKTVFDKLQKNEKQFRTIVEAIDEIVVLQKTNGEIFWSSPSTERISGWNKEDLQNINKEIYVHPDDLNKIKSEFHISLENKTSLTTEVRFKIKHNGYKWFETKIIPVMDKKGQVDYVITKHKDINEKKMYILQLEEKIKIYENKKNQV